MTWRSGWTPLCLFLVAAVWTWPALVTPHLLGGRADALGTGWFVSAAGRLATGLHDPLTGWPEGADYLRPDSWTLIGIGAVSDWLPAARVVGLVAVLGVFFSAWAAEALARSVGARAPWSMLAGIAYALSGLGSTAFIEGYPYHLADPWLPLCGLWWLRAVDRDGTARDGIFAAVAWVLAVLTSAWHGLAGALLVLGVLAAARAAGRVRRRPVLAALGVVGGLAVVAWASSGTGADTEVAFPGGVGGRGDFLGRLLVHSAPALSIDIDARSQTAWFSSVALALALVAPLLLGRDWRVRALCGVASVSLFLAVVPAPWPWLDTYVPSAPSGALATLRAALGRFPERLGWAALLAGAVVAARTLTELVDRHGRLASPLLVVAAVECFVILGHPGRQVSTPGSAPAAYFAAEGAVLDLWPEDLSPAPGWDLRITNTGCFYQAAHRRPIGDICLLSPGVQSPRMVLGAWVTDRLLAGGVEAVRVRLVAEQYSTVAWHPDVFRGATREVLRASLLALDPAPAESTDEGDHVIAYQVGAAS
ncbi:MAG: hypothetical protein EXR71_00180 [Myxococcales bacterium]|nr:hypothetical protein [Myxococcales bacterium]